MDQRQVRLAYGILIRADDAKYILRSARQHELVSIRSGSVGVTVPQVIAETIAKMVHDEFLRQLTEEGVSPTKSGGET